MLCPILGLLVVSQSILAQPFVHPGGLHNKDDLERMRQKVAERAHPWIDGWDKLCQDPLARYHYKPTPLANLGTSRQRASRDAHAAYLNTIRWYISGDDRYADCAIRICNEWSAAVNQVPKGTDVPGLSGIPITEFALAAEVLRVCPRWRPEDFDRFKRMMRTYWYPCVHEFLATQNGPGNTHFWANWNICNIGACIAVGVLLEDRQIFDEGLKYFHSDLGTGSIKNAVYVIHDGGLGQWQESGRDQTHAQLGVGLMAQLCEVAWKQGIDLYGAEDNRLLAGAEYVAQWDMWRPVPYKHYTNSSNANQSWPSSNSRGRLDRPVWELLYNHYVVRKGLRAPNTTAFANLVRVEGGSGDHFGYGTLTFTLDAAKSPFPPAPVPPAPSNLVADAGAGRAFLRWERSGDTAQGYEISRATSADGPFSVVESWSNNTCCEYIDTKVNAGTRYFYRVAARNQSGASSPSSLAATTPAEAGPLPAGWERSDVGKVTESSAGFADVSGGTFVLRGAAGGVGRSADAVCFVNQTVSGDVCLTARIANVAWARDGKDQKVGIMIRDSLDPNSATIVMKLGDVGARQAGMGIRTTSGGDIRWIGGNDYTWVPAWFRLQRKGDVVTSYESSDGERWFEVSKTQYTSRRPFRVGMFVSSGSASATAAQFDHVSQRGR
jgi:hypothetical protein